MEKSGMPIFVKIDKYEEISALIKEVREGLTKARATLDKIEELKRSEDLEVERWSKELEEIQKRLSSVEDRLSRPEV